MEIDGINKVPKPRDREISTGMLRQRRNVFMSSIALIIFVALGFELEKVSLLGNSAQVNNPHTIPILIFIAHAYFTLRYWQYYQDENFIEPMKKIIQENYVSYLTPYLKNKSHLLFPKILDVNHIMYSFPSHIRENWDKYRKQSSDQHLSLCYKKVCVRAHCYLSHKQTTFIKKENTYTHSSKNTDIEKWEILPNLKDHDGSEIILENWIECSSAHFYYLKLKAYIRYFLKQSYFSDYQLPLVLSFLSLIFSGLIYFNIISI